MANQTVKFTELYKSMIVSYTPKHVLNRLFSSVSIVIVTMRQIQNLLRQNHCVKELVALT